MEKFNADSTKKEVPVTVISSIQQFYDLAKKIVKNNQDHPVAPMAQEMISARDNLIDKGFMSSQFEEQPELEEEFESHIKLQEVTIKAIRSKLNDERVDFGYFEHELNDLKESAKRLQVKNVLPAIEEAVDSVTKHDVERIISSLASLEDGYGELEKQVKKYFQTLNNLLRCDTGSSASSRFG